MKKADRLKDFIRRLSNERAARTYDEAYGQLYRILNTVEDELSGRKYDLLDSSSQDRMYPPQWDRITQDPVRPRLTRLRSRLHETVIGNNGSIQIRAIGTGALLLDKRGEDGMGVDDL